MKEVIRLLDAGIITVIQYNTILMEVKEDKDRHGEKLYWQGWHENSSQYNK